MRGGRRGRSRGIPRFSRHGIRRAGRWCPFRIYAEFCVVIAILRIKRAHLKSYIVPLMLFIFLETTKQNRVDWWDAEGFLLDKYYFVFVSASTDIETFRSVVLHIDIAHSKQNVLVPGCTGLLVINKSNQPSAPVRACSADGHRFVVIPSEQPILSSVETP